MRVNSLVVFQVDDANQEMSNATYLLPAYVWIRRRTGDKFVNSKIILDIRWTPLDLLRYVSFSDQRLEWKDGRRTGRLS